MEEYSHTGQFTKVNLPLLLPTDSKAAITCSRRSHLNQRRKSHIFHFIILYKTKKSDFLELGPIADIYWYY